jgi:hypothetical protein
MVWKHVDQSFPHHAFNNVIEGVESAAIATSPATMAYITT